MSVQQDVIFFNSKILRPRYFCTNLISTYLNKLLVKWMNVARNIRFSNFSQTNKFHKLKLLETNPYLQFPLKNPNCVQTSPNSKTFPITHNHCTPSFQFPNSGTYRQQNNFSTFARPIAEPNPETVNCFSVVDLISVLPYRIVVGVSFPSENLARTLPTVPDRVPMPKGHWKVHTETVDGAGEVAKIVTVRAGILGWVLQIYNRKCGD